LAGALDEAAAREGFEQGAFGGRGEGKAQTGFGGRSAPRLEKLDEGQIDAGCRVDPGDDAASAAEGAAQLVVRLTDPADRQITAEIDCGDT